MENQQLPDLSRMDEHWQKMNAVLQSPGALKKPWRAKYFKLLLPAAVVMVVSFLAVFFFKKANTSNIPVPVTTTTKSEKLPSLKTSSALKNSKTQYISLTNKGSRRIINQDGTIEEEPAVGLDDSLKINFIACDGCDKKKDSEKIIATIPDKKTMLSSFLIQLKKDEQEFVIDNNKDTLIACNEGTNIFIPAHSFNASGTVTFRVREFYKYSDMVMNRLVTKSGDDQLITGGMFHLSAIKNGNEVTLNTANPIRVYLPNITAKDSMSIFEGEDKIGKATAMKSTGDRLLGTNFINWTLSTVSIDSPVYKMFIRAMDLRDNVVSTTYRADGRSKAVFTMSRQSNYSKEELKALLEKKYKDYYDKIRVRKQWERNLLFKVKADGYDEEYGDMVMNSWGVGDTAELLPGSIRIHKLTPIDTVYKLLYWVHNGSRQVRQPVLDTRNIGMVAEKYSIQLNKLGWVNCDKFNNYTGAKIEYVVDLKDTSYNYYTVLVFDRFKSLINGYNRTGTIVSFPNIPANEPVKIISIGINKEGKSVYAVKEAKVSNEKAELEFVETTASSLKESLSKIDR